jgi:hypothetical protein
MDAGDLQNIAESYRKIASQNKKKTKNTPDHGRIKSAAPKEYDIYSDIVKSNKSNNAVVEGHSIDEYLSKYKSLSIKKSTTPNTTPDPVPELHRNNINSTPLYTIPDKHVCEDISKIISDIADDYGFDEPENKIDEKLYESVVKIQDAISAKDPLTPVTRKFDDIDELSDDYTLFKSRVQAQLSSLGGGGSVLLKELDDVNLNTSAPQDGDTLVYNAAQGKWIPSTSAERISSVIADAGSHNVAVSENIVYVDSATTVVMPLFPISNESHWISNIYTADITIDGNGKSLIIDGISYSSFSLPINSTLHLHYNSTKDNWYLI